MSITKFQSSCFFLFSGNFRRTVLVFILSAFVFSLHPETTEEVTLKKTTPKKDVTQIESIDIRQEQLRFIESFTLPEYSYINFQLSPSMYYRETNFSFSFDESIYLNLPLIHFYYGQISDSHQRYLTNSLNIDFSRYFDDYSEARGGNLHLNLDYDLRWKEQHFFNDTFGFEYFINPNFYMHNYPHSTIKWEPSYFVSNTVSFSLLWGKLRPIGQLLQGLRFHERLQSLGEEKKLDEKHQNKLYNLFYKQSPYSNIFDRSTKNWWHSAEQELPMLAQLKPSEAMYLQDSFREFNTPFSYYFSYGSQFFTTLEYRAIYDKSPELILQDNQWGSRYTRSYGHRPRFQTGWQLHQLFSINWLYSFNVATDLEYSHDDRYHRLSKNATWGLDIELGLTHVIYDRLMLTLRFGSGFEKVLWQENYFNIFNVASYKVISQLSGSFTADYYVSDSLALYLGLYLHKYYSGELTGSVNLGFHYRILGEAW